MPFLGVLWGFGGTFIALDGPEVAGPWQWEPALPEPEPVRDLLVALAWGDPATQATGPPCLP